MKKKFKKIKITSSKLNKTNKTLLFGVALLIILVVVFAPNIIDLTGRDIVVPPTGWVPLERCIEEKVHHTTQTVHRHKSTAIFSSTNCTDEGFTKLEEGTRAYIPYILEEEVDNTVPLYRCIQTKAYHTSQTGHRHKSTVIFSSTSCEDEPVVNGRDAIYVLTTPGQDKVIIGYVFEEQVDNTVPLYRCIQSKAYHTSQKVHRHKSTVIFSSTNCTDEPVVNGVGASYVMTPGQDKVILGYVFEELNCIDPDGEDEFTKGTTTAFGRIPPYTDKCSNDNTFVLEWVCNPSIESLVGSINIDCPNGCQDGACIEEAPECTENEERCTDDVLEVCTAGVWEEDIDCVVEGKVCDDTQDPPVCTEAAAEPTLTSGTDVLHFTVASTDYYFHKWSYGTGDGCSIYYPAASATEATPTLDYAGTTYVGQTEYHFWHIHGDTTKSIISTCGV